MKFKFLPAMLLLFTFLSAQMPTSFQSRGIGGGGALFSPSINRDDHNEIYMGCDMTDQFHSTDMGGHWGVLPFTQIQSGHDAYVSFTNDPNIRYVVDYTSINGSDYIRPMKSTDAGQTWNVLSGNPYPLAPNGNVLRLIADYNDPNKVIIADYGTIYFSNDGGTSFTQFHTNISAGAGSHIAGVFFDGNNIYIGTNDGLLYSTNGGSTFSTMTVTGIPNTQYMLSFAGAKEGGTTRFVCLTSTSVWAGFQYGSNYYNELSGIYTMDNASGTWTSKMGGITVGTDFPVFVGMAENDIDTMYCSGGSNSSAPIVMQSVGTGNWTHTFITANNQNIYTGWAGSGGDHGWSFPEAPFGFQVCPNDSRMVILTTYSDAHVTTDGGVSWHEKYLSSTDENPMNTPTPTGRKYQGVGLENTTNWQVMWTDSNHLFSAFSDINGVMSDDKGMSWKFIPNLTQNSVYRIAKHGNGNIYACTSNTHDMYQTTRIYDAQLNAGTGRVYLSTDNGASFVQIKTFNGPAIWIALDPTNSDRIYAGVINSDTTKGGIWRTDNLSAGAGAAWTKCHNPPRTEGHTFNINVLNSGDLVVSFSARKPTSGSSFTQSSGVFYSTDHGASWTDRTDNNMKFYTKDVIVDANDTTNNTWYAAVFSAWGGGVPAGTGGVYKTINKGISWTQISNSYRVNSMTINPSNPNELYFTTETDGLWYSSNINSGSPTFSRVPDYPFRSPVRVCFNPYKPSEMWISAFGYGMNVADISCNVAVPTVTPNGNVLISSSATTYQWLLNGNPIPGATSQTYAATQTGDYSVMITDGGSCSNTSSVVHITITDINEPSDNLSFDIYPNPSAVGSWQLAVSKELVGEELTIFDASGRKVYDRIIANEHSTISGNFSSGLYFVKVAGGIRRLVSM